MTESHVKEHGVHYTPRELALFLADVVIQHSHFPEHEIRILDPACGNGALLRAVAESLPKPLLERAVFVGYETDEGALNQAEVTLGNAGVSRAMLRVGDFLYRHPAKRQSHGTASLFNNENEILNDESYFDLVVANPPYVRTQVLGSERAQELARRFQLSGRVDLYHAFIKAMSDVLKVGGTLGLLTSNRFLSVQSGASVRRFFRSEFDVRVVYDLGDTKLFRAAVLPVIVVARKGRRSDGATSVFQRIYEYRGGTQELTSACPCESALDALRAGRSGVVKTRSGVFRIEQGALSLPRDLSAPWSLSTPSTDAWLSKAHSKMKCTVCDVAQVRVGVKSTADKVFIREDWNNLPTEMRPETELLHPLITHRIRAKWILNADELGARRILYPHILRDGKRCSIDLNLYPRAKNYFEHHRAKLTSRTYVLESGRQWFEIWVPQDPSAWTRRKVVFPDITEYPRFFLDTSGAIVNGDCYWITLLPGADPRWLSLILAIANSEFITAYYDARFHNKLYAGRRRFMTQYVNSFPLPDLDSPEGQEIVRTVSSMMDSRGAEVRCLEHRLNELVWRSFGLAKEIAGQRNLEFGVHDVSFKALKECEEPLAGSQDK